MQKGRWKKEILVLQNNLSQMICVKKSRRKRVAVKLLTVRITPKEMILVIEGREGNQENHPRRRNQRGIPRVDILMQALHQVPLVVQEIRQ